MRIKNLTRKVLLSMCSILAVSSLTVGGFTLSSIENADALEQTDIVAAVESYTSILPEGVHMGEYTVLDLDGATIAANTIVQYDMGTHQAVRFQYNKTDSPWGLSLGVYNDERGYHQPYNSGYFYLWDGNSNKLVSTVFGKTVTGSMPSWMERGDVGDYDIEYGGVKCYDSNNAYAGEYYYLEVDGCIIAEYFNVNTNPITTNKFTIEATSAIAISSYEKGTDISANTYVEIAETAFNGQNPIPTVYYVVEKENHNYVQVMSSQYYDVSYSQDEAMSMGTATVTFKGKYTGNQVATYTISDKTEIETLVDGYTPVLPEGVHMGEYTVLDLDGATIAANTIVQYDMGTHQAVRFQYNKTDSPWGLSLGVYNDERGYHQPYNSGYFYLWDGNSNKLVSTVFGKTVTGSMPSWMERGDVGDYDIEYGGVKCYDSNNAYAGEYYYLEVDGCIIAEYFNANTLTITTNKFTINATSNMMISTYEEEVKDISDNAYVEISDAYIGAQPIPTVYQVAKRDGNAYVSIVPAQYYDVTYAEDVTTLTSVATVTFKDKYTGSVTVNYALKEIPEMGILSQGAFLEDCVVKEVFETDAYTTPTVVTDPLVGYQIVGNGENIFRANVKNVNCTGNLVISAKARNLYDAYFYANIGLAGGTWNDAFRGYISFYERRVDLQRKMEIPSFLDWKKGVNIEIGVINVVNENDEFSGIYYYLELDGIRVFDGVSYQVADILAYDMANDFYVGLNGTAIELAPFEKLTINDTDCRVEIQSDALDFDVDGNVKVAPVLKFTKVDGANASTVPLTENDYDIAYSLNAENGTCTITATLNGKFNEETITKVINYTQDEEVKYTVTVHDASGAVLTTQTIVEGETYAFPTTRADDIIGWYYEDGLYPLGYEIAVVEDITIKAVCLDVDLLDGAAIRVSRAENRYGGLRFTVEVDEAQWNAISDSVALHGVLIPTQDINGTFDIDEAGAQDKVLMNSIVKNGKKVYYITLTDIQYQNFNRMYSAKAYVAVTYTNGTVVNFATEYDEAKNARSAYDVAVAVYNTPAEYDSFNANEKMVLDSYIEYTVQLTEAYEVVVDPVLASYTIEKTITETEVTLKITFVGIPAQFKQYNQIALTIWSEGTSEKAAYSCIWSDIGNVATVVLLVK